MVSDAIKEALENKTERAIKLIWEDGSITEADDIAGESMLIEQVLCDGGGISYGQCNASKFKIKVKRENCAGTTFEARCYFAGVEGYLQLGKYTVDSAGKKNQRNFREIIAYDDMRKLQRDVSDWYNNLKLTENMITQAEMLKSLLTYCGITYNESEIDGIVNAAVSVEETIAPSKLQGMQVAEKILEINGVFGTIDWAGTFRIVNMLSKAAEQIDQNRYYTCDYEEYTVKEVNALQLRGEEGDIGYVIEAPEGAKENGYIVTDNFLIYGKSKEELKIIGDNLFKMIKGLTYCPVKLSTRNITYLHMGDYIDIDTGDDIISSVIMKRTIKGINSFRETLTAEGEEYFNYDIEGSNLEIEQLRGKTNILSRTIEGTLSKVEEISKEMGTVSTTIQQLAGQIITEVTSEGEVQSRFSQELGKFLFEGKWFYIHTDNVTIDGTTFSVDNGYIGGLRIGSEGLSSSDYTTLQIFKDGTGKFTNLYACGQGYIDITAHNLKDEEEVIDCFVRTTDGCLMTYDTVYNVTTAIYIDENGNAVFAKCSGKASNITEIKSRMVGQLTIGADGIHSSLDFTAPNLGKGSYGMIQAVDFKTTQAYLPTSDNFKSYIEFNNEAIYKEATASVVNAVEYANSQGYKYIVGAYTTKYDTVHFLASKYQCSGIVIKNCDTNTKQIWCGMFDGTNIRGYEVIDIQGNDTDGYNLYSIYKNTIGSFLVGNDKLPVTYTAEIDSVGKFILYSTGRPYVKLICEDGTTKAYAGDVVKNGYSILRYNHAEVARLQIITPQIIVKYAENSKNEAYEARSEVRFIAGKNITINDAVNGIKINATVPQASETQEGSMSAADKSKLDGIQAGAEQNVQVDWGESDANSDAYIKNKPTSMPASDVYEWAKQPSKPTYTAEEVGADASGTGAIVYDQAKKYADKVAADATENKVDKVAGKGLSTNDLTAALKANYDAAYTHSQAAHAPADAEKNIVASVKRNGTAITPDGNRAVNIVVPTKMSELSNDSGYLKEADVKELSNKLDKTGDASNTTVTFTQAAARSVLTAGEKMSAIVGKIAKWLADIKAVAFTGSFNDLIDKPAVYPPASHTHDDRYYTESEIDTKLNGKANSSHAHTNIDTVGRIAYVGSDADNSAGWYKVYSGTISGWNNNVARLSLMQGYAYINFGILDIHIRCNNTTAVVVHRLGWESRSGFQAGDACIVTGNNTWTLYIYNRNPRYGRIKVRVLDSMGTAENWDMILANNTTKESTTPAYNTLSSDCATVNYANSAGNSAKVNNHTVEADVPANANFTNTWRGIQNNLTSDSTTESLAAAQGKALNTRIDTIWEKLQAVSGDHIFWERTGIASSKINTYYGYYVRHGQIVVYAGTFYGGGSTSTSPTQIITGLPAPIAWTALSVMVNGNDNANHDAYLDTDGSIYMKNITGMQVFISGAYICST